MVYRISLLSLSVFKVHNFECEFTRCETPDIEIYGVSSINMHWDSVCKSAYGVFLAQRAAQKREQQQQRNQERTTERGMGYGAEPKSLRPRFH